MEHNDIEQTTSTPAGADADVVCTEPCAFGILSADSGKAAACAPNSAGAACPTERNNIMKTIGFKCCTAAVCIMAAGALFGARNVTANVTLDADADWSADGTVTIAAGVTVDLRGYTLKVKGLVCNGSIIDSLSSLGYQKLSYIESSGTQWINTGFVTTADTAIECDFTTLNNNDNRAVFCGDWADYGHLLVLNTMGINFFGKSCKLSNFVANKHFRVQTIPGGSKTVVLYDGDTGAEVSSSNVALTHSGTGEMTLFAARADGYQPALCRIHAFKLTHAGTVVRDMVPVVRNADGEAGMYDQANSTFYGNGGSGVFAVGSVVLGHLAIDISGDASYSVAGSCNVPVVVESAALSKDVDLRCFGERLEFNGPVYLNGHQLTAARFSGTGEIANIPGTYRLLSYIESTGTQWINTGFTTTEDTAIEMDFTTCSDNGNHAYYCGDWADYGHLLVAKVVGSETYFAFYGTNYKIGGFTAHKHYKVQTFPGGSKTVVLFDGDTGAEIGSTTSAITHSGMGEMTIFAARADGYQPSSFRLHAFKLTHAGTMVRNFIPVERTVDGKAGLYDLENDAFYPSNGSADFVMGPGTGEFMGLEDNGTAGTFRVDVPNGAHIENNNVMIAGKVCFVKAGAGEYVERVAQANTGGVTLEGGTLSWEQDTPAVKGPLTLAGGTLVIADGNPVSATDGVSVTAPSVIAFRRDVKFGSRTAILNFGAGTPLAQLSLTVTPDPACVTSLALDGDDLQVVLGSVNDVVDAVWTGTADNVVSNPANWYCTNPAGVQIANGLPSRLTTVHIAGTVAMQFLADSDFACAEVVLGDCTLTADCDWCGLGTLPVSGTIDLAGHKLFTAGVAGGGTVMSGDSGGYRFYRFKVDATGGNDMQISEITFHSDDDVLITENRKALHWNTTGAFSGYGPDKAFDHSNFATKWYDNRSANDWWVTVEYEQPVFVARYKWFTGDDTASHSARNPTAWRLQASNDNATWVDLDVVTGATPPAANKTEAYVASVRANQGGDGGELHVEVAEGSEQTISTVKLTGRLKLVKDGAGTLVMAKAGQDYCGGTLVAAGILKPGVREKNALHGAAGSAFTVADGAQYLDDIFTIGATGAYDFTISGSGPDGTGAIRATARTPGRNNALVAWGLSLTLAGDATIGSDEYAFDFVAPNYEKFQLALCGHTLTLKSARPMDERQYPFFLAANVHGTDEGTIVVGDNLRFYPYKGGASMLPNATLVVERGGEYSNGTDKNLFDLTVSNLVYRSASEVSQTLYTTFVLGTYTPTSVTSAPKVVLGDAAHLSVGLDLSERTTEFDVAFGGGFTFTEGSCVKVNLGTRRRRHSERLVAWTEKPVGVTFTGETMRDRFIVRDDGLYVVRGTLIIVR